MFKNEPTIVLGNGAENRVRGTRESGGSVFNVSVTIKDGEHVAAVDPEKVAALFKCTGDVEDWGGAELDASARKTGEEGNVLRFEVTPGDGTERRAFLRIGE